MEIIEDYLNERSTKKNDHQLWHDVDEANAPKNCSIKKTARALNLPKSSYFPQELYYILKNNSLIPDTSLVKTCEIPTCFIHYEPLQYNITSILQLEYFDYERHWTRFEKKCGPQDPITKCINWQAGFRTNGYGTFLFLGQKRQAHAVSWEFANFQEVPEGMLVRHQCPEKNKACVNPNHLLIGTNLDNAKDEVDGGYKLRGTKHRGATMTNEQVIAIIKSLENGTSVRQRAREFNVSIGIVGDIDHAATWKHLMTAEQIKERQRAPRKKCKVSNLSTIDVEDIKKCLDSRRTCAKKYNIAESVVSKIRHGTYKSKTEQDELLFQDAIERILKQSVIFIDPNNQSQHLLWKD